jgi:hypothetical protein
MPPPKIIGQVLQKKIIVKEIQRKKEENTVLSQRKKETLFCLKFWLLSLQGFPMRIPWGPKKEQSHLPCQVQTCPTGATTLCKKEKAYLQQVHVVKALHFLLIHTSPKGAKKQLTKICVQKKSVFTTTMN